MTAPRPSRRPRGRHLAGLTCCSAAGAAALALGGPLVLRSLADVAGAATDVGVAFVVDFGGTVGTVSGCVTVPTDDSGYEALAAFVAQEHLAAPTYDSSGLLCSIGGVPASGCGQTVANGYLYWSYFTASASQPSWTYATTGAFAPVATGDVEGWRFQDPGTGRAGDPPPRSAPDYAALCPPAAVAPGPAPTSAPAAAPAIVPGAAATTAPPPAGPSSGPAAVPTPSGTGTGTTATTATTAPTASSGGSPTTAPSGRRRPVSPGLAALRATSAAASSGPGPVPLVVGGALVVGLAVAAGVRWRRRPPAR